MVEIERFLKKHAYALVRISFGLVFLYFAWDKVTVPQATAAMMRASMMGQLVPTSNPMIYLIALAEAIVGFSFLAKIQVRKMAVLAAFLLAGIILIARVPQDIVLFFLALSMSVTDEPRK
jgi:uncharacterized membrane protein YphA (DoxX/SURF4 family)